MKIRSLLGSKIYPRWAIESSIPDEALFFRTVHFSKVNKKNSLSSSFFEDQEMSCDWDNYTTPDKTLSLLAKQFKKGTKTPKNPNEFFLISLKISVLKTHLENISDDAIRHDPLQYFPSIAGVPNNRAHSLIIANLDDKIKVKNRAVMSENFEWVMFDEPKLKVLRASKR